MTDGEGTGPVSLPAPDVSIERPALYVVATPIGHLGDLGQRAAATLAAVDVIYCEDTRHSRRLLEHYGISTPLRALHDHNEADLAAPLIAGLREREQACALISDAGTPLVSDPGHVLVQAAIAAGVTVIPVPGPCAALAALSVAGLPAARFAFEGFLPPQAQARRQRLEDLAEESRTLVFYEAPHRIAESVAAMAAAFGSTRPAVIARELTKRFESVYRGTLGELVARLTDDRDAVRGEFVVLVEGSSTAPELAAADRVLRILLAETDSRTALRLAVALTGLSRNQLYPRVLALRPDDDAIE